MSEVLRYCTISITLILELDELLSILWLFMVLIRFNLSIIRKVIANYERGYVNGFPHRHV